MDSKGHQLTYSSVKSREKHDFVFYYCWEFQRDVLVTWRIRKPHLVSEAIFADKQINCQHPEIKTIFPLIICIDEPER